MSTDKVNPAKRAEKPVVADGPKFHPYNPYDDYFYPDPLFEASITRSDIDFSPLKETVFTGEPTKLSQCYIQGGIQPNYVAAGYSGTATGYSSTATSYTEPAEVTNVDMSKVILDGKINEDEYADTNSSSKKYKASEVKAKAEKGRKVLEKLNDPGNIESCTKDGDKNYIIKMTDGSKVKLYLDDDGDVVAVSAIDKEGNYLCKVDNAGTLNVDMDNSNDKWDVEIKGGANVNRFADLISLAKSPDKVRQAMGLNSKDFVDIDSIIEDEMPDNVKADAVKERITRAQKAITKLETPDAIRDIKENKTDDGKKELVITLKDNSTIKAELKDDGSYDKVTVNTGGTGVTFDLSTGNITLTVNGREVTISGVISDPDAIKGFMDGAKTSDGASTKTGGVKPIEIERISEDKAKEYAKKYYDIADDDHGDSTAIRIHNHVVKDVNKDNVVEIWEASKKGVVQKDDESLIETITNEYISNDAGGGRDYAVKTAVHIMKQLAERANEVGVNKEDIADMEYWINYDYTGWINDTECLPGNVSTAADDDLGDLLEPRINEMCEKIKDREKLLKENPEEWAKTQNQGFTDNDAIAYGKTLFGYADEYTGDDTVRAIRDSVIRSVNKDNVAKIWKACRKGNGVQSSDDSLIETMTSEYISNDANGGRDMAVQASKHIMRQLVEKAKELKVDDGYINSVEEWIEYDFTGWICDTSCLPGNDVTADDDDLGDLLEPHINQLVTQIELKEAEKNGNVPEKKSIPKPSTVINTDSAKYNVSSHIRR